MQYFHEISPNYMCITFAQYCTYSKLKQTLDKCGLESLRTSGHSFRRGGATFALQCGVPSDYFKLLGDWKSNAYERYFDRSLCYKLETIRQMCDCIVFY